MQKVTGTNERHSDVTRVTGSKSTTWLLIPCLRHSRSAPSRRVNAAARSSQSRRRPTRFAARCRRLLPASPSPTRVLNPSPSTTRLFASPSLTLSLLVHVAPRRRLRLPCRPHRRALGIMNSSTLSRTWRKASSSNVVASRYCWVRAAVALAPPRGAAAAPFSTSHIAKPSRSASASDPSAFDKTPEEMRKWNRTGEEPKVSGPRCCCPSGEAV
jgi:hypothetical protein